MDQTIITDQVSEQGMLVDGIMRNTKEPTRFKSLCRINLMEWLIYIFEMNQLSNCLLTHL